MTNLRVHLLGPPRIEIASQPVSMTRRKSLALLVYLAVTGEEQRRDTLATLFWPDSNQSRARGALRRELSKLTSLWGNHWLEVERERVKLARDKDIRLDVAAFDACPAEIKQAATTENARHVERLAQATALYRDDFLAGFSLSGCPAFDEW